MASFKAARAVAVLLAVAALLAAAAADDEHMYHWKCFKSCNTNCHDDEDAASKVDGVAGLNVTVSVAVPGGDRKCKKGCLDECFEDLPAICYQQCVVTTCLCFPPYSKEKTECMKSCCDKCFHHGPMPGPPGPGPQPPKPPKPLPPPPKPKPSPPPPKPKPSPPNPPKPPVPAPKPPSPCPPGSKTDNSK